MNGTNTPERPKNHQIQRYLAGRGSIVKLSLSRISPKAASAKAAIAVFVAASTITSIQITIFGSIFGNNQAIVMFMSDELNANGDCCSITVEVLLNLHRHVMDILPSII